MSVGTGPLRKIIELEREKGYQNKAVIGGLDKYLLRWTSQVRQYVSDPALLEQLSAVSLPGRGYNYLDTAGRQKWAAVMLKLLSELEKLDADRSQDRAGPQQEIVVTVKAKQGAKVSNNRFSGCSGYGRQRGERGAAKKIRQVGR
jgi:hypothetical protein